MDESNTIKADDTIAAIVPSNDTKGAELQATETHTIEAFGEVQLARRVLAGAVDLFLVFVLFHIIRWLTPSQLQVFSRWQLDFAVLWILYGACFESSSLQTTPGKYLQDLQVVGKNGTRITFRDACLSKSGFIVLGLLVPFGLLQLGFALSTLFGIFALLAVVVIGTVHAYQAITAPTTKKPDHLLATPTDEEPPPVQDTTASPKALITAPQEPVLRRPAMTDNATIICKPVNVTIQLPITPNHTTREG